MSSGHSYEDGEENGSDPNCAERGVPVEQADRKAAVELRNGFGTEHSGSRLGSGEDEEADKRRGRRPCVAEKSGGEPSRGEQGQEDVEMNDGHESVGGTRRHTSLADGSPGSTTGSDSTKR